MKFQMPVKVYFGLGAVKQHGSEMAQYGKKALLVTGKQSAKQSGAYEEVTQILDASHIDYCLFDEIEENPSVQTVLRASEFGRAQQVDFIIGIGGGSPLDAAKAIAIAMKNPQLEASNFFGQPPLEALPVIAIPTTSGTGSEVTQYAVLTDHLDQTKKNFGQSVFPKIAILDPKYTETLNEKISRNTAIDAFTHLAEGFLNANANPVSDGLALKGLHLFGSCLLAIEQGRYTTEVRESLMMASMLAGMVIAQTGTSLPHGMGYGLTYHLGYPHGLANGILFSAYLEAFSDKQKVQCMVEALGLKTLADLQMYLRRWTKVESDQMPTLEFVSNLAHQMASNQAKLKNHPEAIDESGLLEIYKASFGL